MISLFNWKLETRNSKLCARELGVTLVEMIVVITITGILAAAVAVFIKRPVEGYVDAARRAELTDIADTALRRITRDLRTALPNSVRITSSGGVQYLEYLQTSGGGRYRAEADSGGGGDILDLTTADTAFDVIGPVPTLALTDFIVIYNLNSDPAITTANAYYGDNRASSPSSAGATVSITAPAPPPGTPAPFPFASPGKRFQAVQYPVTYECSPDPVTPANGFLRRYWGYTISTAQPTSFATGSNALLATSVSGCTFTYATGGVTGRTGVVALTLQIAQSGESVRLFQQAHVSNVP